MFLYPSDEIKKYVESQIADKTFDAILSHTCPYKYIPREMFLSGIDQSMVPFMFLMNALLGVNGIVWATPIADFSAMVIAILLFLPFWKKLSVLHER